MLVLCQCREDALWVQQDRNRDFPASAWAESEGVLQVGSWGEHFHSTLCKGQPAHEAAMLPAQESKAYMCAQRSIAGFPIIIWWSFFTIQFFPPFASAHLHSPFFPHTSSFSLPTWCSMICIHWYFLIPAGQCSETFPLRSMSEGDAQISCSFSSLWLSILTPAGFWDQGEWKNIVAMVYYFFIYALFSPFWSLPLYSSLAFFLSPQNILASSANKDQTAHCFSCLNPDSSNFYSLGEQSLYPSTHTDE